MENEAPYTGCRVCDCSNYRHVPAHGVFLDGCECGHIDLAHNRPDRGEVPMKRSEKRQRTVLVVLRMTPDEKQMVDEGAAKVKSSLGSFIRDAAVTRASLLRG